MNSQIFPAAAMVLTFRLLKSPFVFIFFLLHARKTIHKSASTFEPQKDTTETIHERMVRKKSTPSRAPLISSESCFQQADEILQKMTEKRELEIQNSQTKKKKTTTTTKRTTTLKVPLKTRNDEENEREEEKRRRKREKEDRAKMKLIVEENERLMKIIKRMAMEAKCSKDELKNKHEKILLEKEKKITRLMNLLESTKSEMTKMKKDAARRRKNVLDRSVQTTSPPATVVSPPDETEEEEECATLPSTEQPHAAGLNTHEGARAFSIRRHPLQPLPRYEEASSSCLKVFLKRKVFSNDGDGENEATSLK